MKYTPKKIEKKWQTRWAESQIYAAQDFAKKPKFVMLTEFPYPSGDAMHMGHVREYTYGDIIARHRRALGFNVLFPMGFDAFGLPAENYAIKNKITPQAAVTANIATFRQQLHQMGYSIDWNRSFSTTDPNYYKWTQWLFLRFFKEGLAYQENTEINWCPFCKTGLANEEVINGRHERCDTLVEKKRLKQWMLRITKYADRLIDGLQNVDFPSRIADQQINWIGRSVGTEIEFAVDGHDAKIKVFTTRPDTIFGATFLVLAPEHPSVVKITTPEQKAKVDQYIAKSGQKSEIERQENKEKSGVFTGAYAINPATNEKIPIWIADYVLAGYGEGAIMAVPAHDERDYEFATKFKLPIKQVIMPSILDILNPPQDGMKEVIRNTMMVHLRDKSTGKYALLEWHETLEGVVTAIMGGIEDGETAAEAAKREIIEEADLKNVKIIKTSPWLTVAIYCASHKGENRKAIAQVVLAEVDSLDGQSAVDATELKNHTIVWVDPVNVANKLTPAHQKLLWELVNDDKMIFHGEGVLINSGSFDGTESAEAREKIVAWLEKQGIGRQKITYKLRDWVFSRQRYWGEPIPIIHCPTHGAVPVPDEQLPVELPEVNHYEPTENGQSPLSAITDWVNVPCPICGKPAKRETDTMPNWAGSCWYYLRYFDAHNNQAFADPKKLKYWGEVDLYLGGMEHTTLHLLYSRFWHQFFYDQGLVPTPEPYHARRGQGIILAADGKKMSKSLGNVINPTKIVDDGYGADAVRLAIAFLAPYNQTTPWNPEGVAGCYRFLTRVWNLAQTVIANPAAPENPDLRRAQHQTIKKVSHDLQNMGFNTAIAALMEYLNTLSKAPAKVSPQNLETLLLLLAPFAPHLTAELFEQMGHKTPLDQTDWPKYNEKYLIADQLTIAVQVNGKLRGEVQVPADAREDEVKKQALAVENVHAFVGNKKPARIIYVPGRIVNIVVRESRN